MKLLGLVLLSLLLILVLTGCEAVPAPPPASAFFVARLQDCKPGDVIPARESFAPGEVPAAVFINYAGQTITVRVNNVTSGAISFNKTDYIPRDRTTAGGVSRPLPPGTYKAEILTGGTFLRSYNFSLAKPVPKKR